MSVKDSSKNLIFQKEMQKVIVAPPGYLVFLFGFICIKSFMCLADKVILKCIRFVFSCTGVFLLCVFYLTGAL